jgi:hypothetical protein
MKSRLLVLCGTPVLSVFLLLVAIGLSIGWYNYTSRNRPPFIAGYDWAQRQQTLLIAVPQDDCGCEQPLPEWVHAGISRQYHVLVVASKEREEVKVLRKSQFPPDLVTIVSNAMTDTIEQLSPNGRTTAWIVENGRMLRRYEGSVPHTAFFKGEPDE